MLRQPDGFDRQTLADQSVQREFAILPSARLSKRRNIGGNIGAGPAGNIGGGGRQEAKEAVLHESCWWPEFDELREGDQL